MSYTYHTNLPGGLSPTKGWVKGVEKSETPGMMLGANGRVLRELPGWMEADRLGDHFHSPGTCPLDQSEPSLKMGMISPNRRIIKRE